MRLGIIARCDDTGLGNQTYELVKMLNPDKVLVVDSSPFNPSYVQHHDWYKDNNKIISVGMPVKNTVINFLRNLDVVLSCETFYHKNFTEIARLRNVKTILQYNFEFFQYHQTGKYLPDVLLAPSLWRFDDMKNTYGSKTMLGYLPPPIDHKIFAQNKIINHNNSNRLLHIAGKEAIHDRNGTQSVIEMLKYSKANYELVIRSQTELKTNCNDDRLKIMVGNEQNRVDLYKGFDAMVLPRRYAGLCLPMNEALMSGLPVFMTNISPNNTVLPEGWLFDSNKTGQFMAKTMIDIYEADPQHMAEVIDNYFNQNDKSQAKDEAYFIGYENFSIEVLKEKYLEIINGILT